MTRVISCRFMRISCSEDDHPLFRRYYARSNRERGVKLLRCFPHCCPEHVQRCYCGSSIHVLVTFATEVSAAARDNLVVCARFEPSRVVPLWPTNLADAPGFQVSEDGERKLRPGEVVSLPRNLLTSGNRKAKQTVWIRADREGESKQTTKNAVLYVLNNRRFPKWLYTYDTSVTRTQREMTHHLVVYVFQLTGSRSHRDEVEAAVLARHESPGFSLISYRRSGNNARDAGCDLPAIEAASNSKFTAVDVDTTHVISSTSDDMEIDSFDRSSWQNTDLYETKLSSSSDTYRQTAYRQQTYQQEEMREPTSPGLRLTSYHWSGVADKYDGGLSAAEDIPSSWQRSLNARNCGFREKGQHLLILWRFLRSVPIEDIGFGADTADAATRPHWLRTAAILQAASSPFSVELEGVMASFLSGLFHCGEPIAQARQSRAVPVTRAGAVIRMTAHLFLRALSFHKVRSLLRSAITSQGFNATGKAQIQDNFVSLVSNVYDQFAGILHEVAVEMGDSVFGNQNASLPQLVDEVLSVVYAQPRFAAVRPQVSALLLNHQAADSLNDALDSCFQAFVALTREGMIAPSSQRCNPSRPQSSGVKSDDDMLWNQRWLLEPGSLQMVNVSSGESYDAFDDLHLLDVTQFIYEFGCIDITMEEKARYLSLRSALSLLDGTPATPMTLVLDGKLRVFRVLPSGLSSIIATTGGWVVGDYVAMLSDDSHSVTMHFFGFAEGKTSANRGQMNGEIQIRRINLSIKLEGECNSDEVKPAEPKNLFVFAHGTVYGSTYLLPQMSVDNRMDSSTLSHLSNLNRAAIWRDVTWTPLWEFQAGYIGMR